jgi:phage-related minor tail protein
MCDKSGLSANDNISAASGLNIDPTIPPFVQLQEEAAGGANAMLCKYHGMAGRSALVW